jgi:hypothetical protein
LRVRSWSRLYLRRLGGWKICKDRCTKRSLVKRAWLFSGHSVSRSLLTNAANVAKHDITVDTFAGPVFSRAWISPSVGTSDEIHDQWQRGNPASSTSRIRLLYDGITAHTILHRARVHHLTTDNAILDGS